MSLENKKTRDSNIELLRIITMVGVIILHYNNPSVGGGLRLVEEGSVNFYFLYVVESICVCAVDLFLIISGYFMVSSSKRDLWKPVQLLTQVILFSGCSNILIHVVKGDFTIRNFLGSLIPSNYFVILYVVVFVFSPYINLVLDNLDSKKRTQFVVVIFLLFSVYPTFVDFLIEITKVEFRGLSSIGAYGSQYGYSVVNFALCYCIGAYLRKEEREIGKIRSYTIIFIWFLSVISMTFWSIVNDMIGYATEKTAWEYCNPLVILAGVCSFLIFRRVRLGYHKSINWLAKGSFTVYLLHSRIVTHIYIDKFINGNFLLLLVHMFGSGIAIYLICLPIYFVYSKFEEKIFGFLKKKVTLPSLEV